MTSTLSLRVAARWMRQADRPYGQRKEVQELTTPVNKPRDIKREIVRDEGKSKTKGEGIVKPDRKDVQPKDVFDATPNFTGVRNFAETGKDLAEAIQNKIPKDKGYETVKNLSQYLVRTEGGGEGGPEGKTT